MRPRLSIPAASFVIPPFRQEWLIALAADSGMGYDVAFDSAAYVLHVTRSSIGVSKVDAQGNTKWANAFPLTGTTMAASLSCAVNGNIAVAVAKAQGTKKITLPLLLNQSGVKVYSYEYEGQFRGEFAEMPGAGWMFATNGLDHQDYWWLPGAHYMSQKGGLAYHWVDRTTFGFPLKDANNVGVLDYWVKEVVVGASYAWQPFESFYYVSFLAYSQTKQTYIIVSDEATLYASHVATNGNQIFVVGARIDTMGRATAIAAKYEWASSIAGKWHNFSAPGAGRKVRIMPDGDPIVLTDSALCAIATRTGKCRG